VAHGIITHSMSETLQPEEALRAIGERFSAGDLEQARELCERALAVSAHNADLQYLAGMIALSGDDAQTAVERLRSAIALNDGVSLYHHIMGRALARAGQGAAAVAALSRAIELDPGSRDAKLDLAQLHTDRGEHGEAIILRKQLVAQHPEELQSHLDLAYSLFHGGSPAEALAALEIAVQMAGNSALAWFNYGVAAQALGMNDRAADAYRRAMTLDPGHTEAAMSLGVLLHMSGNAAGARELYESVLASDPDHAQTLFNLGLALRDVGEDDAADQALARAAGSRDGLSRALGLLRLSDIVPDQGLAELRHGFEQRLEELARCQLTLADVASLGTSWFTLAYHRENNRALLSKLCAAFRAACPQLAYTAPHCGKPRQAGRPRIGFLSNHLYHHTVGLYFTAFIEALAGADCEVFAFTQTDRDDAVTRAVRKSVSEHVVIARRIETAREQIASRKLDVLVYLDIGMEPVSYFLAFARLAPVQACLWGHPETTGIDTIDHFISHAGCETPGSADYYSEQLLLLPASCTYACFPRHAIGASAKQRWHFDLRDSDVLFTCAQAPHKIHPDFDRLVDEILAREPRGRLVVFGSARGRLGARVAERMARRMGERASRVVVLPQQGYADYLAVLACSDVILDTPHFNGGKTTFDAIAMRKPIITLPGVTLKGLQTAHLLGRLGLEELVPASEQGYVDKALELAARPGLREAIAAGIGDGGRVFDDAEAASAFRQLILGLCPR
jgi:protein O-GlcNAc transferase